MSLVKPIINEIVAFDADIGTTITFTASGGDQITGNEIKVVSNLYEQGYFNSEDNLFYKDSRFTTPIIGDVNTIYIDLNTNNNYVFNGGIFVLTEISEIIVYDNTITSYNLSHIIPANVLRNGYYYRVAVRTYDILGNASNWSNYQPFYCYTTPVLALNIEDGQTINNATFTISLTYTQEENEKVDYASIQLYNANKTLVDSSGNLYNSNLPPLTFGFTVFGLENHAQYYTKANLVTINGTTVETDFVRFYTNYETVPEKTSFTATLDSCNGYVNLHSGMICNITGESNPEIPTYIGGTKIDLRSAVADINEVDEFGVANAKWAKWNHDLFTIPKSFLLRLWFYPARQPFEVIRLCNNTNTSYLTVSLRRDTTQDYISIRTDNGTTKDIPLNMFCNGNTKMFLWIKIIESSWTVQLSVLETEATVLDWNDTLNNNISFNVTSDVTFVGETYESFTPSSDNFEELSDEFTTVIVGNGVFDHMNVTKDTTISYTTDFPSWTDDTVLNVDFNNSIVASPHYSKLVLKRRDDTLLTWLNLSELEVQPNIATYINFNDSFIPTGIKQEYALVVYLDGIPSEYQTVEITPTWGKYFLSDKDNRFGLNYAVIYSNHLQNIQNGVFMPIGANYPIVVQNGEGNYRSGSLQFKVLGYQFDTNKTLDRVSITKQLDDMLKFLTNGKAKCLTDFNGNIFILKVINSPQISYDANWGNGIPTVSFDWVEQGKYNNYNDMLNLGLFDYIAAE